MHAQTQQLIHKHMTIGDVVNKFPQAVETLSSFGVHCIGCGVAVFETIEQGLKGHGMNDQDIDKAVEKLNDVLTSKGVKRGKAPPSGDGSGKLSLTETAAKKISDLLKNQNKDGWGLRIKVIQGGCSGFSYSMQFEQKPNENDTVLEEMGVKLFVDKETIKMIDGSSIDYIESLQESGFKVNNPSAKASCGCGKSFV